MRQPLVITNDQMRDHHLDAIASVLPEVAERCCAVWVQQFVRLQGADILFPLPCLYTNLDGASSWHFPVSQRNQQDTSKSDAATEEPLNRASGFACKEDQCQRNKPTDTERPV